MSDADPAAVPASAARWLVPPSGLPILEVQRLGRRGYGEVYELQKQLVEQRIADAIPDQLVLVEHEPVVTIGRGTDRAAVANVAHPIYEIERGGEATYHGPGQLVAYPIVKLDEPRRDLHRWLRDLEEIVIRVLAELDVAARREPGLTGVWVADRKIASIGVAVRSWVTWHGLALNLTTTQDVYAGFRPCGLEASVMTSLAEHTREPFTLLLLEVLMVKHACLVLGRDLPAIRVPVPEPPRFPELPILPG
jgi:lipoyl(octanoyl) transferase